MQRDDAPALDLFDPELLQESADDLYENAPCGYLSTLLDGTIVRANRTFLDWTGYAREELVGRKRLSDILTVGGRMYYETHYAPLLQMQGSVREIAVDLVGADGNAMPVLISATVRRDGSDSPALVRTTVFSARDRRRYEQELVRERRRAEESEARARALARTLQDSLIPPAPPRVPGLDIAGVYRPAGDGDEVGGDFYDVFETPDAGWAVVIGDVSGKGAEAAGITALARYTIRAAAMRSESPEAVLEMLNRALLQQKAGRFCTAVYCTIRPETNRRHKVRLAVGGHPLPLLLRDGQDPRFVGHSGMLLGSFDDPDLHNVSLDLGPGDSLLLYTDGVTEGRRGRDLFGDEGLLRAAVERRGETADGIASGIAAEVVDFQDGLPRDDIAIVALKIP